MIDEIIAFLLEYPLKKNNAKNLKNFAKNSVSFSGSLCEFLLIEYPNYAKRYDAKWDVEKNGFYYLYDNKVCYNYKEIPSLVSFLLRTRYSDDKIYYFLKMVKYIDTNHPEWDFVKIAQFLKLFLG